jgi:hypothetical protein
MGTRANVTSVDAVKDFRANLIVYTGKARPTLEEVASEVVRMRVWLETEQRVFWEAEARRRQRRLEDAQQAYFSARMSLLREASAAEKMAVTRAKNALDEAEGKLKTIKRWSRDFDSRTEPLARQLEKMHTLLSHDMPRALAFLNKVLETLDDYANIAAPAAPSTAAPASSAPAATAETAAAAAAGSDDKPKAGGNS